VLGEDPAKAGRDWRERIGIVLQSGRLDPYLTVRESLDLYAGYFRNPRPTEDVIALIGLEGKADERASRLSGGQQRRLDVGMALVGDPELLFLDEPTTGFDPSARRQAWEVIAGLRDLGKTVFLTTHYMDEAQRLADRVTIIAAGRIVARGTPADLGNRAGGETTIRYRAGGREVSVQTNQPVKALNELTGKALADGEDLEGLEVTRPSLEDVYLELTAAAETETAAAEEAPR
jgi:ABC-2 type transport system ATP-binding protein